MSWQSEMHNAQRLAHLIIYSVSTLSLAFVSGGCSRSRDTQADGSSRQKLETGWRAKNRVLVKIPYEIPDSSVARAVQFTPQTLRDTPLYLRHKQQPERFLFLTRTSEILRNGDFRGTLKRHGQLLFKPGTGILRADGETLIPDLANWDVFWVTNDGRRPDTTDQVYPEIQFADRFMRTHLATELCRPVFGKWRLNEHGGGMPTTQTQTRNYNVQRAVNPFSVFGSHSGRLEFGSPGWINYRAETSFYFGIPRTGNVVDRNTEPDNAKLLLGQGQQKQGEAAFGWVGPEEAFILFYRPEGAPDWTELERYQASRPPLTNWVRLGIEIESGTAARCYLDGAKVIEAQLPEPVRGPAFLLCGKDLIEVDDLAAKSLYSRVSEGDPVYVRSRNFAGKKEKDRSDPAQFAQWARGARTFLNSRVNDPNTVNTGRMILSRLPLMGEIHYSSRLFDDSTGKLPYGKYDIRFYETTNNATKQPTSKAPVFVLPVEFSETGWKLLRKFENMQPVSVTDASLRLVRKNNADGIVAIRHQGAWIPLAHGVTGPCHVGIVYWGKNDAAPGTPPSPRQHQFTCRNLTTELFEEAPVGWSWIEGAFRMDSRWACQDQWNFMACGSVGVPYMVSKKIFGGDQVHEYYISIRPVYPWDAGDKTFQYSPHNDPGHRIFRRNNGWYVRRDLNFSFCTDGVNPMSGYSIIFAGDDNQETRLVKQGRVVARTTAPKFRIPTARRHTAVHWKWWKFTVHKRDNRIQVFMNGELMFDFRDPAPLKSGHTGFWTIRNGFAVTKVVQVAENIERNPRVLYVQSDTANSPWRPQPTDSATVRATETPGVYKVKHNVGAGFFAVRYTPEKPTDLVETPIVEFPYHPGSRTALNLHVAVNNRSFIIRINAPLTGMKSFLTPEYEKGECFQLRTKSINRIKSRNLLLSVRPRNGIIKLDLGKALRQLGVSHPQLMLQSITLGNTSNDNYMLAGGTGQNRAGAHFLVGTPQFRKKQKQHQTE